MINPRYQGEESVAITRFRKDSTFCLADSPEELAAHIADNQRVLGEEYRVLAIYHGVGPAAGAKLEAACENIRQGNHGDLTHLLD